MSFSHTTGTGTDRLMLVGVSWNCGTTDRTISSVTFTPSGGSATTADRGDHAARLRTPTQPALLGHLQAAQPAERRHGDGDSSPSAARSRNGIVAGAADFAGVDQTTPLGTPAGRRQHQPRAQPSACPDRTQRQRAGVRQRVRRRQVPRRDADARGRPDSCTLEPEQLRGQPRHQPRRLGPAPKQPPAARSR